MSEDRSLMNNEEAAVGSTTHRESSSSSSAARPTWRTSSGVNRKAFYVMLLFVGVSVVFLVYSTSALSTVFKGGLFYKVLAQSFISSVNLNLTDEATSDSPMLPMTSLLLETPEPKNDKIAVIAPGDNKPKVILLWSAWFGDEKWKEMFNVDNKLPRVTFEYEMDPNGLNKNRDNASLLTCDLTYNKTRLPEASAIVVHGRDFRPHELMNLTKRQPWQRLVFFLLESAYHSGMEGSWPTANQLGFNWSMGYWHKSDVVYGYGRIPKRRVPISDDERKAISTKIEAFVAEFTKREKDAIWLVSNCMPPSRRGDYVQKMVDAGLTLNQFGACNGNIPDDTWKKNGVPAFFANKYRYYLAFENSLCDDYFTEKVFISYYQSENWGLIPVIYAGDGLAAALPNGSYVDARSMSPSRLVEFLHELAKSPERVAKYFDWMYDYKFNWRIDPENGFYMKNYYHELGWKSLCERLWSVPVNKTRVITDLAKELAPCKDPTPYLADNSSSPKIVGGLPGNNNPQPAGPVMPFLLPNNFPVNGR